MFLSLSSSVSVEKDSIIGIFDMDNATSAPASRAFLRSKEKKGELVTTARDIPKSFVLTDDKVYLVQYAPSSLENHL